jgi:hypothetical protein
MVGALGPCSLVPVTQATALMPRHLKTRKGLWPYSSPIQSILLSSCDDSCHFQACLILEFKRGPFFFVVVECEGMLENLPSSC